MREANRASIADRMAPEYWCWTMRTRGFTRKLGEVGSIAMDAQKQLGSRLRFARTRAGFASQGAAAQAAGVPPSTLQSWESGLNVPSILNAKALADLYGVSCDWLVGTADSLEHGGVVADEIGLRRTIQAEEPSGLLDCVDVTRVPMRCIAAIPGNARGLSTSAAVDAWLQLDRKLRRLSPEFFARWEELGSWWEGEKRRIIPAAGHLRRLGDIEPTK